MPVTLKDAEITVKMNLEESEKDLKGLEERTEKQRKAEETQKKAEEREKRRQRGAQGRRQGGRGGLGAVAAGVGLAGPFRRMISAGGAAPLPPGVNEFFKATILTTLLGMSAAELTERFGPAMKGFVEEALPGEIGKILPMEALADLGQWWPELKAKFQSIGQAFDQTRSIGAAIAVTGGEVSADLIGDIFGEERAIAIHKILLAKRKKWLENELIGGALGRAFRNEADKLMEERMVMGGLK